MKEQTTKKLNRIKALAAQWKRDPRFKEFCKNNWEKPFFEWCEKTIADLEAVDKIEIKNYTPENVKFLDVNEINWNWTGE